MKSAKVGPDAPVITITGVCPESAASGTGGAKCNIVITEAEFAKVVDAIQPNMPPRARREFALRYANALIMASKAKELGLDSGERYGEQLKLARLQILSKEMDKAIEEKASQISEADIRSYYEKNISKFEKAELYRIYIPRNRTTDAISNQTSKAFGSQESASRVSQTMKDFADELCARALAGEEFEKLQEYALKRAGVDSSLVPNVVRVRRVSLAPEQQFIMDLRPGEISPVIADGSGYFIYKVKFKKAMPLDQAREEIRGLLRSQRVQKEIEAIEKSAYPTLNETYFDFRRKSR